MSAIEALRAARAADINLTIDGDDLVLEASVAPPDTVLELLSRHKAGVLALLRPGADGRSVEEWQAVFEERAGIAEVDGGPPRLQAEAMAYTWCVAEWLNRNPAYSPAGSCFGCGGREHPHNPLLPFGIGSAGCVWLHSRCQSAWYTGRKAEAVAALEAMGIISPANFADDFGKNGVT